MDTWILSSPSEDTIHSYFKNELSANGKVQHYAGYYLYYRCHSTPLGEASESRLTCTESG